MKFKDPRPAVYRVRSIDLLTEYKNQRQSNSYFTTRNRFFFFNNIVRVHLRTLRNIWVTEILYFTTYDLCNDFIKLIISLKNARSNIKNEQDPITTETSSWKRLETPDT